MNRPAILKIVRRIEIGAAAVELVVSESISDMNGQIRMNGPTALAFRELASALKDVALALDAISAKPITTRKGE